MAERATVLYTVDCDECRNAQGRCPECGGAGVLIPEPWSDVVMGTVMSAGMTMVLQARTEGNFGTLNEVLDWCEAYQAKAQKMMPPEALVQGVHDWAEPKSASERARDCEAGKRPPPVSPWKRTPGHNGGVILREDFDDPLPEFSEYTQDPQGTGALSDDELKEILDS